MATESESFFLQVDNFLSQCRSRPQFSRLILFLPCVVRLDLLSNRLMPSSAFQGFSQ
jgi:hypothetical protein